MATNTSVSSTVRCHAAEDSANHYPQQGISGVVRSRYIVHAILRDQFLESSLRLSLFKQQRVEHRDSLASLLSHHLHRRYVGVAVAEKQHPLERDPPLIMRLP